MAASSPYPFSKIANFRDISTSLNNPSIKPGLLYRSANPDLATPADQNLLQSTYKIRTIIDLRTDSEHLSRKDTKNSSSASRENSSPKTNNTNEEIPADVPVIDSSLLTPSEPSAPFFSSTPSSAPYKTLEINFNGPTYSSHLFSQLSYWHRIKLATLYGLGYRTQAISIIGSNVMAQRGLTGLAKDSLKYCRAEIKSIFDVLANEENWPVMVHCTQGKDRTGLVVLLVLGLLDVSKEEIKRDYLLSIKGLEADFADRVKAIAEIGLPEEFAGCPENWVEEVFGEIESQYGGFENFLVGECGVKREQVEKVKQILRRT